MEDLHFPCLLKALLCLFFLFPLLSSGEPRGKNELAEPAAAGLPLSRFAQAKERFLGAIAGGALTGTLGTLAGAPVAGMGAAAGLPVAAAAAAPAAAQGVTAAAPEAAAAAAAGLPPVDLDAIGVDYSASVVQPPPPPEAQTVIWNSAAAAAAAAAAATCTGAGVDGGSSSWVFRGCMRI
ncbi:hypothetical protein ETH_00001230 [Eimeria tenella]|uniref:Uncharacterized protein n=1 Tax=Eimeria tenella TaxID=5802 RepID=U6KZM2_EIMTE|nr:hypothetical protein ETH_00001230 [Eimeria tenella]CDJ41789.1 hypothetical protein ETH_00001230 [Eimeria tenella]|eukprot:XP_013232539.1 hypothetical protein ETH_00001230 [Eimeria tenella]